MYSLIPPLFVAVMYVLGVYILPLSTILRFDVGTVPTGMSCLLFLLLSLIYFSIFEMQV
jgi:hypothetical protein